MKVKVVVTKNTGKSKKSYRILNLNKTQIRSKSNHTQNISPIKTSPIILKKNKPKYKPKKILKQSVSTNVKEVSKNTTKDDLKDIDKYLDYYIEKEIDEFNSAKNDQKKNININDLIKKNKSQNNLITENLPECKPNFEINKNNKKINIKVKNKSPIRLRKFNINKKKYTEPLNIKKAEINNSYFNYIAKIKSTINCVNEIEPNKNNDSNTIKNLQEQIESIKKDNLDKEYLIENMKKQVEDFQKEKNMNNGIYLLMEEIKSLKQKFNINDSNGNSNRNNNNGNDINLFDELKNSYLCTKKLIEELKQENEKIKKQIDDKNCLNGSEKLLSISQSNDELKTNNIFISPFFNSNKLYQEFLIKNNLSNYFNNSSNFQDVLSNYIQIKSKNLNLDNINDIEPKQLSEIRLMIKMTLNSNEIPEEEIISFFMDNLMNYTETIDKFMFTYLKLNNFMDKQLLHDYFLFISLDENKKFNILNIFNEIKNFYDNPLEKPDKTKLKKLCSHTSEHMNLVVKECKFYDNLNTGLVDYHKFVSIFKNVHEYDTNYDEERHKILFNYCLYLMRNYNNVKQFELFKLYYPNLEDDPLPNIDNKIKEEDEDSSSNSNNIKKNKNDENNIEKEEKKEELIKENNIPEEIKKNSIKSNIENEEKKNSIKSNSATEDKKEDSMRNNNILEIKKEYSNKSNGLYKFNKEEQNNDEDFLKKEEKNENSKKNILQNQMLANLEMDNLKKEDEKEIKLQNGIIENTLNKMTDNQNDENIINKIKNSENNENSDNINNKIPTSENLNESKIKDSNNNSISNIKNLSNSQNSNNNNINIMNKNNINSHSISNNTENNSINSQNIINKEKNQNGKISENNSISDNNLSNNINNDLSNNLNIEEIIDKKIEKTKKFSEITENSVNKRDSLNLNAIKSSTTSPSFSNEDEFLREVIQQTLNKTNDQNDISKEIIKEDIKEDTEKREDGSETEIIKGSGESSDSNIDNKKENKNVNEKGSSDNENIAEIAKNYVEKIFREETES